MFKQLLIFCCIAVSYAARSHLEIRQWLLDKSLECTKDNFISSKEMQMMMKHQLPNTKSSNCFIACVFKKAGWMTDKGVYDQEAVNKFAEEEYAAEPTKLENAKKLFEMCKKVNDETVGDGEAGCDRAKLLAECFLENAPKLDLMQLEATK